MKIILFSDSHFKTSDMQNIIQENKNNTDLFIHLGDRVEDVEEAKHLFPKINILNVRGNNDYKSIQDNIVTEFLGITFYITHGHKENISFSNDMLLLKAKNHNAKVVLFGHTHKSSIKIIDNIYFINPGSISFPRDGTKSYGEVIISENSKKITANIILVD